MGVPPEFRVPFWRFQYKDFSILGSELKSLYFGKLFNHPGPDMLNQGEPRGVASDEAVGKLMKTRHIPVNP